MQHSSDTVFDLLIIGGGINGTGIARDAAGRSYSVCLCESNDLASGTSSASSKLIHGGLRYLEHYEFRLVREALKEREVLLRMAPHIISPMRFVLPHVNGMRAPWLLRLGLYMYDHLSARNALPCTSKINLASDIAGNSLKSHLQFGFEYSDCWVDDSRLVIFNAIDASNKGAKIKPRTRVVHAESKNGTWHIHTQSKPCEETVVHKARVLVNAAGPWADEVLYSALGINNQSNVRLVRGSHIVVNKLFEHNKSYVFQNSDGRIFFAIPYEKAYTLIGTTDKDHNRKVGEPIIDSQELQYLCDSSNAYFKTPITPNDVIWSYSGVRPLYDNGTSKAQDATRDYVIKTSIEKKSLLINIFGGKITTYRRLAETILKHVEKHLGQRGPAWTNRSYLPGANIPLGNQREFTDQLHVDYPFLEETLIERYARSYGTISRDILGESKSYTDLGRYFGAGLFQKEIEYMVNNEWASSADDILFRRTKLGIKLPEIDIDGLNDFLKSDTGFLGKSI